MTTSAEVRGRLVSELRLDLVGPRNDDPDLAREVMPEPPSRWCLTGFPVPLGAPPRQKEGDPTPVRTGSVYRKFDDRTGEP